MATLLLPLLIAVFVKRKPLRMCLIRRGLYLNYSCMATRPLSAEKGLAVSLSYSNMFLMCEKKFLAVDAFGLKFFDSAIFSNIFFSSGDMLSGM